MTAKKNDFLFNGIERETELDLGWDVAEYRSYDPAIGRWLQIDPKASERESPYVGFGNRPNFFIDPLGDTVRLITENDPRTNDGATYVTDEVVVKVKRLPNGNPWEGFKEGWSVFKDDDNSTDEKIEIPLAGEGNRNTSQSGLEEGIEVVGDDGGNNAEEGNGVVFYEVNDYLDKVGGFRGFFTPTYDFSDHNSTSFIVDQDGDTLKQEFKGSKDKVTLSETSATKKEKDSLNNAGIKLRKTHSYKK